MTIFSQLRTLTRLKNASLRGAEETCFIPTSVVFVSDDTKIIRNWNVKPGTGFFNYLGNKYKDILLKDIKNVRLDEEFYEYVYFMGNGDRFGIIKRGLIIHNKQNNKH